MGAAVFFLYIFIFLFVCFGATFLCFCCCQLLFWVHFFIVCLFLGPLSVFFDRSSFWFITQARQLRRLCESGSHELSQSKALRSVDLKGLELPAAYMKITERTSALLGENP